MVLLTLKIVKYGNLDALSNESSSVVLKGYDL